VRSVVPRLALVIACVLLIGLLALQVWTDGPVTRLDQQVTLWLVAHRQPWLTLAMSGLSAAHQTRWLLAATALIGAWLAWRREFKLLPFLLVVPAGMLANAGLKVLFARPRPHLDDPLVRLLTLSFPSGHAVASMVFYGVLCRMVLARSRHPAVRATAVAGAAAMVLLVTFSRVYLGAHYVSDVVAGVAFGSLCLAVLPLPPWREPAGGPRKDIPR
jgi:membrane-associated phospholipid phosphatase